jgi:hypothetical protein
MEAVIIDPIPIQPLWRRFGREYVEDKQQKVEWFQFNPTVERQPSSNVYQECYAPLDATAQYVRKRQFPPDPGVWTSEPFLGEPWSKDEFQPKCTLENLQFLPTWHKVTAPSPPPVQTNA